MSQQQRFCKNRGKTGKNEKENGLLLFLYSQKILLRETERK